MLLSKKTLKFAAVALFAICPMIAVSLDCRADETAPAATETEASAPAPVAQEIKRSAVKSVSDTDMDSFIKGFFVKKVTDENGTRLTFLGHGHPSCLRHLRFELDTPLDDDSGVYGLRIEKSDLTIDGKVFKADDDCSAKITKQCTRDAESGCISINEPLAADALGIRYIEGQALSRDGKIQFRIENRDKPEGHPEAITYRDIPKALGGPLDFKSPETIMSELRAKEAKERNDLIMATCKGADKNRDDLEALKDMLGKDGIEKNAKLIEKFEKNLTKAELEAIEKKIDAATSLADLNEIADELAAFGRKNPGMKKEVIRLLTEGVGLKGLELESEKDGPSFNIAKLKLAERSLKLAKDLDPKSSDLKSRYHKAKLERFKYSAETGSDKFYNASVKKEFNSAMKEAYNWARKSRDGEAMSLAREYQNLAQSRWIQVKQPTPYGPMPVGYMPGTTLDQVFANRYIEEAQSSLMDEYRAYSQGSLFDGLGGGKYNFGNSKF